MYMIYVYNYAYCRELKPGELHYCVLKSETAPKDIRLKCRRHGPPRNSPPAGLSLVASHKDLIHVERRICPRILFFWSHHGWSLFAFRRENVDKHTPGG